MVIGITKSVSKDLPAHVVTSATVVDEYSFFVSIILVPRPKLLATGFCMYLF